METRSGKKLTKERMAKFPFPSSIKDHRHRQEQAIRNPVILEAIFLQCPIKTLKHCRLVSKQWYDLSLQQWRSRAVLKLESVQIKRALRYQRFFGNPYENLEQPFAYMMKFETRPYRRLRIGKGFPREVHAQHLVKFLAPHLHELHLDSSIDNDFSIKLIFELTPNLKNLLVEGQYSGGLKDLTFCAIHEQQNLKKLKLGKFYNLSVSWHALLSTFTKLEVILLPVRNTYFVDRDDFFPAFAEFLRAVKTVKSKNPDNLPVHHLDVLARDSYKGDKFIPESIPTLLSEVNFPLKTLKIDVRNTTTEAVFQRLLNLYCDTLESLVIMRGDKDQNDQYHAPSFLSPFVELMKSLKSLEIFGPILNDMSCLQYAPNLEKLSICESSFSGYFSDEKDERDLSMFSPSTQMVDEVIEDFKLNKLEEFNTYFTLENAATVKTLGSWMPNLEKLRVRVTSGDGFGEMCSQWGNTLRELVLGSRSFLVDEDITGFAIGKEKDKCNRAPNVTLLKNLQVFRMEEYICSKERLIWTWPIRNDNESDIDNESADIDCIKSFSKITDHAVHHGFLELAQLHTLELQSTKAMEVKTRSLLKKKGIDVTTRIRTSCTCCRPLTYEVHRNERMRISNIRY